MAGITITEIEQVAFRLARETLSFNEPIPDFTTRYPNILESSLNAPFQTFAKKDLYPSFTKKASMLFYLMIKNHPFKNGNKRIAMTTLFYYVYKNKKWIKVDSQKLYSFAMWVTESPAEAKDEAAQYTEKFIKKHMIGL